MVDRDDITKPAESGVPFFFRPLYRYLALTVLLCFGFLLFVYLFLNARARENEQTEARFRSSAKEYVTAFKDRIHHDYRELDALHALYAASHEVERHEFKTFVRHLIFHNPAIQALEWIPRVRHARRAAFTEAARKDGFPDFQINEVNGAGAMVPAREREEYYPVYFIEPYEENETALGFDLASDATRLEALTMARDTGNVTATSRIRLVQEKGDHFGFLVFYPVYDNNEPPHTVESRRSNLKGFVLGVYRIGDILEDAVAQFEPRGIDIYLFDRSSSDSSDFLYYHSSRLRKEPGRPLAAEDIPGQGLTYSEMLDIAGRKWLMLCSSIPEYGAAEQAGRSWFMLAGGLFFTLALSGYLFLILDRAARTREYADSLRESELRFRKIFDNAMDGILLTDVETKKFVTGNRMICSMMGYSLEELRDLGVMDIHPGKDLPFAIRQFEAQARGELVVAKDIPIRKKDGSIFFADVSSTPIVLEGQKYLLGVFRDITERKQSEERIQRERDRAQKYLDVAGVMFLVIHPDQTVGLINEKGCEILGYPEAEIIGKNWFDFFIPENIRAELRAVFDEIMQGKIELWRYNENPVLTKEGDERIIAWHNTVIRNEQGKISATLSSGEDISERRKLEDQLRHAQKMEEVGQLAGGVAHDFNNILTAIMGYANLLQIKIKEDDPLRMYVDQILDSSEKAANLIQSLLAFSKKQIISPRLINLNEIVRSTERLLARVIGEDITLQTVLSDKDIKIMADPGQIEQVIVNLATNARDAMPQGGILNIRTEVTEVDEAFATSHGYGRLGNYALLTIRDSGTGMNERTSKRIFEPFFSTKEVGKGTGLGLSMVYGIIKQHDGFIDVKSKPAEGTAIHVYLPLSISDETEPLTSEKHLVQEGSETILVAEDDAAVRKLTRDLLEKFGYVVITAADGEEAIQKYYENKDSIQMLLLDVIMPKKNGRQVYDEIRKDNLNIKALFLSGYTADLVQKKALIGEGLHFILKPAPVKELLSKVREVLDS